MTGPKHTYNECIKRSMELLGIAKTDERFFLSAVLEEASHQKTTSQAIFLAIMESNKVERKKWRTFFHNAVDAIKEKRQNQQVVPQTQTIPPKPKVEYAWNFESSSKVKTVNSIWPTGLKNPVVQYTPEVKATIDLLVATCTKEVGWLGTVSVKDNVYTIDKIFIPKQTVCSVETDIDQDALSEIDEILYASEGGSDRMYYWGHSHVNMPVSPSKQDEEQVREYLNACPKFIRAIHNKAGDYKIDFYDRETRLVFQNLDLRVAYQLPPDQKQQILDTIKANVIPEKTTAPLSLNNYRLPGMYSRIPVISDTPNYSDLYDNYDDILKDPFGVRG